MAAQPKPAIPNPAAVLPGEADILANVIENLADDTAKLVYADWLEDRDDPRGPLLRKFVTAFRARKKLPAVKGASKPWRDLVGITLTTELRRTPLAAQTDAILALARPAISFASAKAPEKALAVGASKFGGCPDLPAGTKWPKFNGFPLSFLGQFNLAELSVSPVARDLPSDGLFSVFSVYDEESGNDDFEKNCWRFFYTPASEKVVRHELDAALPTGSRFPSCRLTFSEALNIPADDSPCGKELSVGERDSETSNAYFDLHMDSCPMDHLLGYPFTVQDDILGKKSMRHLLTIDGNSSTGWDWGDGGALYFAISAENLKNRRFDLVRFEMQCG